ncbi:MAG: DUF1294 domain-containing protein [Ruminococcaceae bacterium]|nr:DUF1294 domain-containing protein [Oscillospiraceae bacterium]
MKIGYLEICLIAINLITFVTFGIDKLAAIKGRQRIRERNLLLLAFIGGSVGGLFAMYLFWHKIRKLKFKLGIPLMFVLHTVAFLYFKWL